jgi:uncharacterized protein (TIGR02996 family)
MNDEAALLAAIVANPDEDTPRLVLADWYQENDQAERAEFIRVQVELARLWAPPVVHPVTINPDPSYSSEFYTARHLRSHREREMLRASKYQAEVVAELSELSSKIGRGTVIDLVSRDAPRSGRVLGARVEELWQATHQEPGAPRLIHLRVFGGKDHCPHREKLIELRCRQCELTRDQNQLLRWFGLPWSWAEMVLLDPWGVTPASRPYAVAHRGFLERVSCRATAFINNPWLLDHHPIRQVGLVGPVEIVRTSGGYCLKDDPQRRRFFDYELGSGRRADLLSSDLSVMRKALKLRYGERIEFALHL